MSFAERIKEQQLKFAVLDIETKPLVTYTWGLWRQNIGLNQIKDHGGLLCYAIKWIGEDSTKFYSEWDLGKDELIRQSYEDINNADVVVTYNGDRFDLKTLNSYYITEGYPKPKPYKSVDLFKENKKHFNFPSKKLDYLAQRVVNDHKTAHTGFDLWTGCMNGDKESQALMEKYNRQDVLLTEKVYLENLSWWAYQPHMGMFTEAKNMVCPKCGSKKVTPINGETVKAHVQKYQLLQCVECMGYSRSTYKEGSPQTTRNIV